MKENNLNQCVTSAKCSSSKNPSEYKSIYHFRVDSASHEMLNCAPLVQNDRDLEQGRNVIILFPHVK